MTDLAEFLRERLTETQTAAVETLADASDWPQFVIDDCDAKMRIIDVHQRRHSDNADEGPDPAHGWVCAVCGEWSEAELRTIGDWPCLTLRLLALPFATHPEYVEAWRV